MSIHIETGADTGANRIDPDDVAACLVQHNQGSVLRFSDRASRVELFDLVDFHQ